jgi:hypothetical protein
MLFYIQPYYNFILEIMACISFIFSHLLSTNHKCTQPCPPAVQKLKKMWSTSIGSSRQAIATGRLNVELWCLSAAVLLRVFDLVFYKTLFGKYIML